MSFCLKITNIHAREILDSRGNPTVEADVTVEASSNGKKTTGRADHRPGHTAACRLS